ncbi:MAG: ribbon-helix-helix protein, CopG family [Acidobacteriia bacterium]|nr:ribbon-helix-helix protein, CopG family [Terriglobia bacterium]
MRTTKTLSITLPPEMLSRAEAIARRENRTMSELVREALRTYERQTWWDEMRAYGRAKAARVGVNTPEDVVRVIHEHRQEQRLRHRKRPRK